MSSRLTAYLLLILATAIWGIAGPVIKYSLDFIGPFNLLFWRLLLTSIITLPILIWYTKKHSIPKNFILKLVILGLLCSTLNLSLVFLGIKYTSIIEATILGSIGPILIVIASHFYLREPLSLRRKFGLILVFAGSTITLLQPLLEGRGVVGEKAFLGNILIFLGIICWMFFVILSKKWEHESIKPFHISSVAFFVGAITFLPLALLENNFVLENPFPVSWEIGYLAIFSSLIAYTAYEVALSKIQASEAEVFNYLAPLWSTPLAILWLGEVFHPVLIVSVIFIVTGIILVEYRKNFLSGLKSHHHVIRG